MRSVYGPPEKAQILQYQSATSHIPQGCPKLYFGLLRNVLSRKRRETSLGAPYAKPSHTERGANGAD